MAVGLRRSLALSRCWRKLAHSPKSKRLSFPMDAATRDEEAGLPQAARVSAQDPSRQRSSIPSLLFLTFLLFMLTSHNGDEFLARHQHQDALRSLTWQLSNYTAWMNGTESNFTVPDRDPTLVPLLDTFGVQGSELDPKHSSYYSNVTGFIHGSTQFFNISPSALASNKSLHWRSTADKFTADVNMTEGFERLGSWDWASSGKVALSVVEKKPLPAEDESPPPNNLALVHGRIELTDVQTSKDLRLEFEGIHFLSNGSIYGFAEPTGRHIDIRLLPSLVPEDVRNETAKIIGPELTARIKKLTNLIDAGIVDQDSSSDDTPKTNCPFTFFAHIHSVPVPEVSMQELEDEIQNPTGITTVKPPKLSITGLLISKECGIMYKILDTEGLRSRTFFRKVTTYAGFSGLAYLAILILFSRQVERSRTPSGISRVSRWTFLSQATMDSVSFAGHITFAILAEGRPSLSLIVPAFLACILFVQEAQFFALVNQIQGPETYTPPQLTPSLAPVTQSPAITPPPPQSPLLATPVTEYPPPATAVGPTPSATLGPPPRPTAPPPAAPSTPEITNFFSFFIHHIRTDAQARLWVFLFIFLTLIVRVILSPTLSMLFVGASYSSIWLPQIIRSARRGRTSGFSKEYIIGTTVCRLYSALYFLACPKNVLEVEPRSWASGLAIFVILQALLIILQDSIGPSFFLPQRFKTTKIYDYHPVMPLPDPESPDQSLGDCAICMDAIIVDSSLRQRSKSFDSRTDPDEKGTGTGVRKANRIGGASGLLNAMQMGVGRSSGRKNYSLAPCFHLFHTDCLEKWLAIKNICPQCRRPLPPL